MNSESEHDGDLPLLPTLALVSRAVYQALPKTTYHITKAQLLIFSALSVSRELNMSQIASFMGSSKEQATRAVAPLVDKGLIERFVKNNARTYVFLRLTEDGQKAFLRLHDNLDDTFHELVHKSLADDELAEFSSALQTITRFLTKTSSAQLTKKQII